MIIRESRENDYPTMTYGLAIRLEDLWQSHLLAIAVDLPARSADLAVSRAET